MRKLAKGLGNLLLLCLIGGAIAIFLLRSRLPDKVASSLSKQLGVGVEIGDIGFSMHAIEMNRLEIGSPLGYKLPKSFSSDTLVIQAPLTSYLKNDIVIEEIHVSNVYIGLEFDTIKSTQGNWSTILANADNAQAESSRTSPQRTVLIKRLLLTNIQAELLYQSEGKIRKLKPIPQIELKNISNQGGDIGDQILNSALGQAVKQIFVEENLKDILDQLMQSPAGHQLKNYLGPLKSIFGALEQQTEEPIAKAL